MAYFLKRDFCGELTQGYAAVEISYTDLTVLSYLGE